MMIPAALITGGTSSIWARILHEQGVCGAGYGTALLGEVSGTDLPAFGHDSLTRAIRDDQPGARSKFVDRSIYALFCSHWSLGEVRRQS
jgi:hypothetical protein